MCPQRTHVRRPITPIVNENPHVAAMRPLTFALLASVLLGVPATAAAQTAPAVLPPPLRDLDFPIPVAAEIALGQQLFHDPILGGNRNISCASCHHPRFATGDGLSLGLGEGGVGLGPDRREDPANAPEQRIPRNSPALFNVGAAPHTVMFHDGRIEADPSRPTGLRTPLEDEMVAGFASLLAAQTMFPVLSPDEMAGHYQENEIARLVRQGRLTGSDGAWAAIAARVAAIPAYQQQFDAVYPVIADGAPISFTDISNAIAAFVAFEWRADQSPFDAHLRGEQPLTGAAERGMDLFYGPAGCAQCHSGPLLSDMDFHAMGQPQLGPGKAARFESHQLDVGRMRVTGRLADAYAFRTPPLRNVVHTGPWGHAGAFSDLDAFLRHHIDPSAGLAAYLPQATLPALTAGAKDWAVMDDPHARAEIAAAATTAPTAVLSDSEMADLLAFLAALTDPVALAGRLGVPETVPSGLAIDR